MKAIAYYFSRRNRQRKLQLLFDTFKPQPTDTIVDVGVNAHEYSSSDNYLEKHYLYHKQITAVGLTQSEEFALNYPAIRFIQANGIKLPFRDNEFAISYANAVLEHVGSKSQQVAFIKELYRVAKNGYLGIPNKYFPVEVHTRIPLLHLLLPKHWFNYVAKVLHMSWATGDYMHFLGERELTLLLKEAGIPTFTIHKQRLLGFTLTLVATWQKE